MEDFNVVLATIGSTCSGIGASSVNLVGWSIIETTTLRLTPVAEIDFDLYSTKST